jgi:hypothetical protein
MAAMMDPRITELIGQSPMASGIQGAAMAHINEHVAWAYRAKIEAMLGQQLPDPESPVPEEMEHQMAPALANAAKQLLQQSQQEKAQEQAAAVAEDPVFKLQAREIDVKELDQVRKATTDAARIEADSDKARMQAQVQVLKILSDLGIKDMDRIAEISAASTDLKANAALEMLKIAAKRESDQEAHKVTREQIAANKQKPSGE